jgi:lysophospholipase
MANALERAPEVRLPLLILQAGDDRLVDPRATENFASRVEAQAKESHVYPGLYHEIFNELPADRELVFADLERWLEARLVGS